MKNSEAAQAAKPEPSKLAAPITTEALDQAAKLTHDEDRDDHYYDMPCTD